MATETLIFKVTFELTGCPTHGCGVQFAVDGEFIERRRQDHKAFFCPNGHSMSFKGKNEAERLRAELDQAQAEANWQKKRRERAEQDLEATKRQSAARKGQITRMRNRIVNGVCPVPGCKRSGFDDVRSHIATVHPTYHAHEDEK